jgi:hypothetical protein
MKGSSSKNIVRWNLTKGRSTTQADRELLIDPQKPELARRRSEWFGMWASVTPCGGEKNNLQRRRWQLTISGKPPLRAASIELTYCCGGEQWSEHLHVAKP